MPSSRCRRVGETSNPHPYAASTCSHTPAVAHTSAISSSGSMVPKSVVPAVATTAMTVRPARRQRAISCRTAPGRIRRSGPVSTTTTASGARPSSLAAFCTLK